MTPVYPARCNLASELKQTQKNTAMKNLKNLLTIALFAALTFNVSAKTSSDANTDSKTTNNVVVENALKSLNVAEIFDDEITIENWMVQLKTWKATKNIDTMNSIEKTELIERDDNIKLENWMIDIEQFNNENEENLVLESWMFNF